MITRNFKNLAATILESSSGIFTHLPVTGVNGKGYFLANNYSFPGSRAEVGATNELSAGICFGTGTTPAKETDIDLENMITSGIHISVPTKSNGLATPDYPWIKYNLTITNTSESPITISEVGYKQIVKAERIQGASTSGDVLVLLDRTLLDNPLTIGAGDAGVIEYTLQTIHNAKYIDDLKIVSFAYGTDEEVTAMIDAAALGTIDLQTDGGWQVGDTRTIHIDAFTGGNNVNCPSQDIDIFISSFDDYNNCGCVLQFDFADALSSNFRMNSTNSNTGGYAQTEMYTTTIPALVEALPSWLKTRLKTFDVLASAGDGSSSIVTVPNNKLALRSEIEIFNATPNSASGEGTVADAYKLGGPRVKRSGRTGSAVDWWGRSRAVGGSGFCTVNTNGTANTAPSTRAAGLAPFGCI